MSVKVAYKTTARATGGRDGTAESLDGTLKFKLATPKELGGAGGEGIDGGEGEQVNRLPHTCEVRSNTYAEMILGSPGL